MGPNNLFSRLTWDPTRFRVDNFGIPEVFKDPKLTFFKTSSQLRVIATATPLEMREADIENGRRNLAGRLKLAVDSRNKEMALLMQHRMALLAKRAAGIKKQKVRYEYQMPPRDHSRDSDIEKYLFENRLELALDTMDFPMPENTMFGYIIDNGGLVIDLYAWRSFLIKCKEQKRLFSYGQP